MIPNEKDLADLEALALETDTGNGAPMVDENGVELPPATDYFTEAGAAVDTFAALIVGYAPAASSLWDVAAKDRMKAALAPVMEKYQFTLGALPPEVTLLIVAGPVLYQSAKIIGGQMAEQKAKEVAAPVPRQHQQQPARVDGQADINVMDPRRPDETPAIPRSPQVALYDRK